MGSPLLVGIRISKLGSVWQTGVFTVVLKKHCRFREPEKLPNSQDYPAFHSRKCTFLPPFGRSATKAKSALTGPNTLGKQDRYRVSGLYPGGRSGIRFVFFYQYQERPE